MNNGGGISSVGAAMAEENRLNLKGDELRGGKAQLYRRARPHVL